MTRKVEVVSHNPNWHSLFETESKQITIALGENIVAIHYIGSTSIETIAFRDHLNVHIEDPLTYSSLKRSLESKYPHDIDRYMDGKHDFIQEIDRKAAEWRMQNSS